MYPSIIKTLCVMALWCCLTDAMSPERSLMDMDSQCPHLAYYGLCTSSHKAWLMDTACKLSCHQVRHGELQYKPPCEDQNRYCPQIVAGGSCPERELRAYCPVTCRTCNPNNCAARTCPTGAFQGQDCQCYCDSGNRANPIQVCNSQSVTTPRPSATTTTTAAPSNCEDRNTYCPRWASAGYCTGTYVTYMMTNCQASCNYCSMTTTTTTTMPTPPMPNCSDNNRYCSYWAARGECSNNPSYMNRNCARSCNTCEGGESDCRDMNSNCPNWTSYCTNNVYRDYLERNCMLSCNVCTANDETSAAPSSTTARPSSNCKNMMGDKYCEKSARKCATRPSFRRRCQKTCGSCRA